MLKPDLLAFDHLPSERAGLLAKVLDGLSGVDRLWRIYANQANSFVTIQQQGVAVYDSDNEPRFLGPSGSYRHGSDGDREKSKEG